MLPTTAETLSALQLKLEAANNLYQQQPTTENHNNLTIINDEVQTYLRLLDGQHKIQNTH